MTQPDIFKARCEVSDNACQTKYRPDEDVWAYGSVTTLPSIVALATTCLLSIPVWYALHQYSFTPL